MALGEAIGGLFGIGSSALSSMMNYAFSKKLMNHQYKINQKSLLNSPLQARKGFVKAGYNPLLALGSSGMGFSASSSGVGADLSSGLSDGINSAMSYKQNKAVVENTKEQTEKTKEERKGVELDNRLKERELNLSPKSMLSDFIEGKDHPVVSKVKSLLGVDNSLPNIPDVHPHSSVSSQRMRVDLSNKNGKPYVQKGVPRSVVKQFSKMSPKSNSAVSSIKSYKDTDKRFRYMTDSEVLRYDRSRRGRGDKSRPPRTFPY